MSATPPIPTVRPGDLILTRAIKWWDSGQIQRAALGILLAAAGPISDMIEGKAPATLRNVFAALIAGLFAWIGIKRATSPDVVTGMPSLDKSGTAAKVDSVLLADIQRANAATAPKGGG